MELRHLRYFIAAAEGENISRAALKLHVSQPALSRQIHDLEEEIGVPRFERGAKSLRLTDAGRVFFNEARAVIRQAAEAVKKARAVAAGPLEEIHVGYAPSLTLQILPRALRAFQARFPDVRVALHDLSTDEMLTALRDGGLDVALMARPLSGMLRGLRFEELALYPMCVAVPREHPLGRKRAVTPEIALREPLIAYNRKDYPEYHEQLDKLFAGLGRKPSIAEEHDGVASLVAAVEAGRGLALVPGCLACMVGPRLKLVPITPALEPVTVGVAWRNEKRKPTVEPFVECAKEAAGSGAGSTDRRPDARSSPAQGRRPGTE